MPNLPRRLRLAVIALAMSGCTTSQVVEVDEFGAAKYSQMVVEYELNAVGGAVASRSLSSIRLAGNPAADEDSGRITHADGSLPADQQDDAEHPIEATAGTYAHRDRSCWLSATLTVLAHHPDAEPGMARAILRLSRSCRMVSEPEPQPLVIRMRNRMIRRLWPQIPPEAVQEPEPSPPCCEADEEIRVYDFPRQELDVLLEDLASNGFFDEQRRLAGGAHLSVSIDGGTARKSWTPEPRLDDLIMRVCRDGHLPVAGSIPERRGTGHPAGQSGPGSEH